MKRLPALPLAVGVLLIPIASATVRPHHHVSAHPIVSRSASTHSTHISRVVEHTTYSGISTERATEIQSALIQRGYLAGDPTGTWDAASISAMQKMQSDNGWQTKYVPDSRALIKLGLGNGNASAPNAGSPSSGVPSPGTPATIAAIPGQTF